MLATALRIAPVRSGHACVLDRCNQKRWCEANPSFSIAPEMALWLNTLLIALSESTRVPSMELSTIRWSVKKPTEPFAWVSICGVGYPWRPPINLLPLILRCIGCPTVISCWLMDDRQFTNGCPCHALRGPLVTMHKPALEQEKALESVTQPHIAWTPWMCQNNGRKFVQTTDSFCFRRSGCEVTQIKCDNIANRVVSTSQWTASECGTYRESVIVRFASHHTGHRVWRNALCWTAAGDGRCVHVRSRRWMDLFSGLAFERECRRKFVFSCL